MHSVLPLSLKNLNYLQAKVGGAETRVNSHPFHRSVVFVVATSLKETPARKLTRIIKLISLANNIVVT